MRDLRSVEARFRRQLDDKIEAIRTLQHVHNELLMERDESVGANTRLRNALDAALAEAKRAGFTDAELEDWRVPVE